MWDPAQPGPVVSLTEGDDGLDITSHASAEAAGLQRVLLAAGMRNEQAFVRVMVNAPGPPAVSNFCSTHVWWADGPAGPLTEPMSAPVQPRATVRLMGTDIPGAL